MYVSIENLKGLFTVENINFNGVGWFSLSLSSYKHMKNLSTNTNNSQISLIIPIDELLQQFSDMERSGAIPPCDFSLKVRDNRLYVVGFTFGWTLEQQAVAAVYEALEKWIPAGVDAVDVVDIIYDEEDSDCESTVFFGGIAQATPMTFKSRAGYDFKLVFD